MAADRPNFLIFVTDEQPGYMLSCAGHPVVQTPNIDRLAAGGVRLDRCYTVHPMCMTTRATWFTGRTPRGHGVRCNGIPLDPRVPTMPDALRRAGYHTVGIGKHHLRNWGTLKGADPADLDPLEWCESRAMWRDGRIHAMPTPYYGLEECHITIGNGHNLEGPYTAWLRTQDPHGMALLSPRRDQPGEHHHRGIWVNEVPLELHYNQWMTDRATATLRQAAATGESFFLWHSFCDPHPPYTAPRPFGAMYDPADSPPPNRREGELDDLPPHFRFMAEHDYLCSGLRGPGNYSEAEVAARRAMTYGMVSHVDYQVGQVLDELERLGLADNTVVVFMSDHGRLLGDHFLDNMPPCHFDETLRIPSLWRLPGRFPAGEVRDGLASHLDFAPTILELAGVAVPEGEVPLEPETDRQRPPWPGHSLVPLIDGSTDSVREACVAELDEDYLGLQLRTIITADHWLTVYGGDRSIGELFDLREDPQQLHNRFDDPAYQAVKSELLCELAYQMIETGSTLPRRLCHA